MKIPKTKHPKPLNIRQERFAEFVASGMSATEAYIKAGYTKSVKNAETNSWRVRDHEGVKARIAEIMARTSHKFEMSREKLARHLFAAATTPAGEIDENSPLSCEVTIDVIGGGNRGKLKRGNAPRGNETIGDTVIRKRVKGMDKVAAARLLCEMMGWKEPEQVHQVIDAGPNTLDMVRERARAMASPLAKEAPAKPPEP